MEKYFVKLTAKAIADGKGSGCNFKQAAMMEILKKCNTKLKVDITSQQMRYKYDMVGNRAVDRMPLNFSQLKKSYKEVTFLLKQSGFGWDPHGECVDNTDEVWERLHQVTSA